jgi:hypothetical protein
MKTFLMAFMLTAATYITATAQTAVVSQGPKNMTKADKEVAKAKKEADLMDAFTKAGLTAEEQLKTRAALDAGNEKTKPIKADAALTEADKKQKLDAIYKERNDNLKTLLGDAKYKLFKAAQKAQKEAAGANAAQ